MKKILYIFLISLLTVAFASSLLREVKITSIANYELMKNCEHGANNIDGITIIEKVDNKCHFTKNINTFNSSAIYDCYSPLDVIHTYSIKQISNLKSGKSIDDIAKAKDMNKYCTKMIKKVYKTD